VAVGSSVGEGEGCSEGLGEEDGVGVADWSVKLAHGLGCTLAHSLWTPGASPERGWTRTLKLPLPSAVALPATLVVWSQYRLICWLGRNWPPVTLITVVAGPAVTSSERNALIGVGKGLGDGAGVGETTGLGDSAATVADGLAEGDGALSAATTTNQTGKNTRSRRKRMKSGNGTRRQMVTPAAMESTRPRSARGNAIRDRARREGAASEPGSRRD